MYDISYGRPSKKSKDKVDAKRTNISAPMKKACSPPYSYSIVDDAAAVTLSSWGEVSGTQTRRDEFESKSLYSKVIKEGARVENCALTEEFSAGKGIKFMGIDLRHN
jgi:hypothetical protein